MIIVRETFVAKPGMASKLATMVKDARPGTKVMTDMTGPFHQVVMETMYENLEHFEQEMAKMMKGESGPGKSMAGYTEMYTRGKREIYRVW